MRYVSKLSLGIILILLLFKTSYGQFPITVYGYSDLVARNFFERQFPNGAKENPPPTFLMLRTHVLLNSHFAENWQAFVNIRFQNGARLGSGDPENKGQIELLEAWFEYRYRHWLSIRGGQFLAPFGYFNVRKFQSPIFNTVVLPVMYEEEFLQRAAAGTIIPPLQTVQISGELSLENWRWGYQAYIGNGSDTDDSGLDVNTNKGVGARFWLKPPIRNLLLGVSFYTEEGTFAIRPHVDMKAMMRQAQESGVPMNQVVPIVPVVLESETRRTIGIDTRYLYRNLEIRAEYVKSHLSDLSLVNASAISDTTRTYTFDASGFAKTFYYIHVNYSLFDKLTPYFEINVFKDPRHFVFRNKLTRWTVGAAFRPIPNVALKAEFHDHQFGEAFNKPPQEFKNFQMVWAAVSVFFN